MRDHRKLKVFQSADALALEVYRHTSGFPDSERFGLVSQMRRASVSVASNIVEGCARTTSREYLRFLEIAFSSSRELGYQLSLARRLEMGDGASYAKIESLANETTAGLAKLLQSLDDNYGTPRPLSGSQAPSPKPQGRS